jgi:hypothetical protein
LLPAKATVILSHGGTNYHKNGFSKTTLIESGQIVREVFIPIYMASKIYFIMPYNTEHEKTQANWQGLKNWKK